MPPGVLVTRPEPRCHETAARLSEMGYIPFVAPMLRIARIHPQPRIDLSDVQALLVTSENGAGSLARAIRDRTIPVLAVGERTATFLRTLGFRAVTSAGGNASDLAALTLSNLNPAGGTVLHARGKDVDRSPLPMLSKAGFDTRETILYRADPVNSLPDSVERAVAKGRIHAVLMYSARSAEAFRNAIQGDTSNLTLISISETAQAPLAATPFASRTIARTPAEAFLFESLKASLPL